MRALHFPVISSCRCVVSTAIVQCSPTVHLVATGPSGVRELGSASYPSSASATVVLSRGESLKALVDLGSPSSLVQGTATLSRLPSEAPALPAGLEPSASAQAAVVKGSLFEATIPARAIGRLPAGGYDLTLHLVSRKEGEASSEAAPTALPAWTPFGAVRLSPAPAKEEQRLQASLERLALDAQPGAPLRQVTADPLGGAPPANAPAAALGVALVAAPSALGLPLLLVLAGANLKSLPTTAAGFGAALVFQGTLAALVWLGLVFFGGLSLLHTVPIAAVLGVAAWVTGGWAL